MADAILHDRTTGQASVAMGDDKGRVYEKGWDGQYRPKEGFFSDPEAEVKKDFLGNPVEAHDSFGNPIRADDGSRLYEARKPILSDEAAGGLIGLAIMLSLAILAALAWVAYRLVGWWFVRLKASASRDLDEGRLSWTTLAWLAPAAILGVALAGSMLTSRSPTPPSLASGAGAMAPQAQAAAPGVPAQPPRTAGEPGDQASAPAGGAGASAGEDIGGLPDLSGYCVARGYSNGAATTGPGADTWTCVEADGSLEKIDLTDACRAQYQRGDVVAVAGDASDSFSWRCWTTTGNGSATASTAPRQLVEAFLAQLDNAYRQGDVDWLLQHLHPAVIDAYSPRACSTAIEDYQTADFTTRVRSVEGPTTWTYGKGNRAVEIADVYTIKVRRTRDGAKENKTIHLALVGGELRWFSNC